MQAPSGETIGIFLGRPLGTMGAGPDCGSDDQHGVHNMIFAHPHAGGGGSTFATVIVIATPEPVAAGSRVTQVSAVTSCAGPGGLQYDRYKALLE